MSSVNIYSSEGMCPMTLFLASSQSSSVFGITVFISNYFQLLLNAKRIHMGGHWGVSIMLYVCIYQSE